MDDLNGFDYDNAILDVWHRHKIPSYMDRKVPFIDTGNWYLDGVGCQTTSSCHKRPTKLEHPLTLGGEACAWELTEGACTSQEQGHAGRWERQFDRVVWKKLIGFAEAAWSHDSVRFGKDRATKVARDLEVGLGLDAGTIEIS